MSRRVLPLIIGSLLLPLGCGGNDDPTPTGPTFATLAVATGSLPNAERDSPPLDSTPCSSAVADATVKQLSKATNTRRSKRLASCVRTKGANVA